MKKIMVALLLSGVAAIAVAQALPGPGNGPHPPHGAGPISPEALATIPDLTAAQQIELRKALTDRRDAHEAVEAKSRAEREALMKKDRAEHERIDNESADRLRKLLGDDGYRRFAEWQFAHHGPGHGFAGGPLRNGPPGPGERGKRGAGADGED